MDIFIKDPAANLDYSFDLRPVLQAGETISTQTVVADAGLVVGVITQAGGVVTVWLSGGENLSSYQVSCSFTTNQGRTDKRSFVIYCQSR